MRRLALPGLLVFLMLLIPTVVEGKPPLPSEDFRNRTAHYDDLLDQARASGAARVIVGLDLPFQPEGRLSSQQAVKAQQLAIAQSQNALLNRLAAFSLGDVKTYRYIPYLAMEVDEAALSALQADPAVASIREDALLRPTLEQNVPIIGGPAAWDAGFAGQGWSVVVIDTGVDTSHPFLADKTIAEACFSTTSPSDNTSTVCPNQQQQQIGNGAGANCQASGCEHGTHVAGIAVGRGEEFSGVARDANLIAIQTFSALNSEQECALQGEAAPCSVAYNSNVLQSLEHVYDLRNSHQIAAVNMSLGGGNYNSESDCDADNPDFKAIIDTLQAAGIATVVSSGNQGSGEGLSSPACISSAISVGATTLSDNVAVFTNSAPFLDLLAPGSQIISSVPGGEFASLSGTSMASPMVAGAWAVLKSETPSATPAELLTRLKDTGVPVLDPLNGLTRPRIQLDAALNAETRPVAPSNLVATPRSATEVGLTWDDFSFNEDGFIIERRTDESDWQEVETVEPESTSFTDSNLVCGTTYTYRVRSFNEVGSLEASNTALSRPGQLITSNVAYQGDKVPIQDFETSNLNIEVNESGLLADVDVRFDAQHTFVADLGIFLISPQGTRIELSTGNGQNGDNYIGTIFDDEAENSISGASPPFTGRFRPEEPLGLLNGEEIQGTWTLEVIDAFQGDVGSVTNFELDLTTTGGCQAVTVTPPDSRLAGGPGATVTHTLQIENSGIEEDTFSILIDDTDWPTRLSREQVNLSPDESSTVQVVVEIPGDVNINDSDTAQVTVRSEQHEDVVDSASLQTSLFAMAVDQTEQTIADPEETPVVYTLTITNTGVQSETFAVEVADALWKTTLTSTNHLTPTEMMSVTLGMGQVGEVLVSVAVPATIESGESDTAQVRVSVPGLDGFRRFDLLTRTALPKVYVPMIIKSES